MAEIIFCFYIYLFFLAILFLTYYAQYFKLYGHWPATYIINNDIIHIIYIPQLHNVHIHTMDSYSLTHYELVIYRCGVSKCQSLTRPNVLNVLLEYINLFDLSDNMQQPFRTGCPVLYHFVLLYFILSIAIATM